MRQNADDSLNDLQIEIVHGTVAYFGMKLSPDLLASCRCASCLEVFLANLKTHYYHVDPETFDESEESPTYSSERAFRLGRMSPMYDLYDGSKLHRVSIAARFHHSQTSIITIAP